MGTTLPPPFGGIAQTSDKIAFYGIAVATALQAEQVRSARLANFAVMSSILVAAWLIIFVSPTSQAKDDARKLASALSTIASSSGKSIVLGYGDLGLWVIEPVEVVADVPTAATETSGTVLLDDHRILLVTMSAMGILLALFWIVLGFRGNAYFKRYDELIGIIEKEYNVPKAPFTSAGADADKFRNGSLFWPRTSVIVIWVPILFMLLYAYFLYLSCRY